MNRILFAALLAVTACATTNTQANQPATAEAGSGSGSDMICTDEAQVGTMRTRTVCRKREDTEDERDTTKGLLQRPRNEPTKMH